MKSLYGEKKQQKVRKIQRRIKELQEQAKFASDWRTSYYNTEWSSPIEQERACNNLEEIETHLLYVVSRYEKWLNILKGR